MDVMDSAAVVDPTKLLKALGGAVLTRRLQLNVSQEQLCKDSGINRSLVVRLESGLFDPDMHTLCQVAATLECAVYELFEMAESEN
jgi:transcriptional regulator with XRE-family HTH domain